jgi:hypothetical protein
MLYTFFFFLMRAIGLAHLMLIDLINAINQRC